MWNVQVWTSRPLRDWRKNLSCEMPVIGWSTVCLLICITPEPEPHLSTWLLPRATWRPLSKWFLKCDVSILAFGSLSLSACYSMCYYCVTCSAVRVGCFRYGLAWHVKGQLSDLSKNSCCLFPVSSERLPVKLATLHHELILLAEPASVSYRAVPGVSYMSMENTLM